jgi:hypothetical protein
MPTPSTEATPVPPPSIASEGIVGDGISRAESERFLSVFGGHILFQTLYAAVEFDLFTRLAERPDLGVLEIAEAIGIQRQPVRILLLGLVSSGLLRRDADGRYRNTRVAEVMLTRGSPKNILSYVRLQHHVMYRGMFHFREALGAGTNVGLRAFPGSEPTLYQRLANDPPVARIFQEAMHELSVQANEDLAKGVDLSGIRRLVDVGGGDGTNAMQLLRRFPDLEATVFDLPEVCAIAREKIVAAGLQESVRVAPGDCFADPLPAADCFLLSHFCTIWSEAKNRMLFAKAYAALPEGGRIVVFNMMQEDDESGPLTAAIGSPYFLTIATGEGMLYTWSEYERWLREAGFGRIEKFRLPRDHGAIVGFK